MSRLTALWLCMGGLALAADAPAPPAELLKRANAILDAALADSRAEQRSDGLGALGASKRADSKEKLTLAVTEDDGHVRFGAAQGMRFLADPETAPAIVAAWRKEKGWRVKKELSLAAGATGARDLVPDLKAALLYETQQDVREAVAWSLDDLGEPDGKAALAQLGNPERKKLVKDGADSWSRHVLEGKKQGDHRLAAKTLAMMGKREDAPLLQKELDSTDVETRLWAAAAIIRLAR
jgi:hypothetical protein